MTSTLSHLASVMAALLVLRCVLPASAAALPSNPTVARRTTPSPSKTRYPAPKKASSAPAKDVECDECYFYGHPCPAGCTSPTPVVARLRLMRRRASSAGRSWLKVLLTQPAREVEFRTRYGGVRASNY